MREVSIKDGINDAAVKVCPDTPELDARKRLADHGVSSIASNQVSGLDGLGLTGGFIDDVDGDGMGDG